MVDHCLNLHTSWAIGAQNLTLNYRILGHLNSKAIDLQILTHQGQTCIDTILLALQTVGCREGRLSKQSADTQAFTSNRTNTQGHRDPRATHSYLKDHLELPLNIILADVMAQNKRVMMFLPRKPRHGTIWGAACLAKDSEIRSLEKAHNLTQKLPPLRIRPANRTDLE